MYTFSDTKEILTAKLINWGNVNSFVFPLWNCKTRQWIGSGHTLANISVIGSLKSTLDMRLFYKKSSLVTIMWCTCKMWPSMSIKRYHRLTGEQRKVLLIDSLLVQWFLSEDGFVCITMSLFFRLYTKYLYSNILITYIAKKINLYNNINNYVYQNLTRIKYI